MQNPGVIAICLAFVSRSYLIDMNKPADHGAAPFFFDRKPIHPPLRDILRKYLGVAPVNLPKP
jgi:hypothetical protein